VNRKLSAACILTILGLLSAAPALAAVKTVMVRVSVDSESPGYEGFRALDGNPESMWHSDCNYDQTRHPHQIVLDLGACYEIAGFGYLPRPGGGNGTIARYECWVSRSDKDFGKPVAAGTFARRDAENVVRFPAKVTGRYVRLRALSEVNGQRWTSIAELRLLVEGVQFRARESVVEEIPHPEEHLDEMESQFAAIQQTLGNRAHFAGVAAETYHSEALVHPADRDPADVVLRRTSALLADLKTMRPAPALNALEPLLRQLQSRNAKTAPGGTAARRALFEEACRLRRQIAFANPLLDFDKLLFIKRYRAVYDHMCDQFYGITAQPGGGICVLCDPFGPEPRLRDLLAGAVVQRGRLKGQRLAGGTIPSPRVFYDGGGNLTAPDHQGGSFLSPDVSYDGRSILFAFVECQGDKQHRHHTDPSRGHWAEGRCYHVFKVNADGSALEQLTDGTWNDFDPCWLPNGRIAFITERRGGYLRCGRVCPNYTLYDMAADGSDITALSFHETNEWQPSVTHDGRIIYTRWDYVDRFGCTAHHPWITTLDGRDSRALQGNFAPRNSRPDMELGLRAIPDSHKFVATAAPHHGLAFGSLVMIDPRVIDDDGILVGLDDEVLDDDPDVPITQYGPQHLTGAAQLAGPRLRRRGREPFQIGGERGLPRPEVYEAVGRRQFGVPVV